MLNLFNERRKSIFRLRWEWMWNERIYYSDGLSSHSANVKTKCSLISVPVQYHSILCTFLYWVPFVPINTCMKLGEIEFSELFNHFLWTFEADTVCGNSFGRAERWSKVRNGENRKEHFLGWWLYSVHSESRIMTRKKQVYSLKTGQWAEKIIFTSFADPLTSAQH